MIPNLKWDSLTFCEISRQQSRKNRKVVYFEWLTSGNSLIIACGQLNEQRMLLLPQMPTWIRRDTVGFHHPFRFQPQKERPPTLTSQIERKEKIPEILTKKKKKKLHRYSGFVSRPHNPYQECSVQPARSFLSCGTKGKDWVSSAGSKGRALEQFYRNR